MVLYITIHYYIGYQHLNITYYTTMRRVYISMKDTIYPKVNLIKETLFGASHYFRTTK